MQTVPHLSDAPLGRHKVCIAESRARAARLGAGKTSLAPPFLGTAATKFMMVPTALDVGCLRLDQKCDEQSLYPYVGLLTIIHP